MKWNIIKFYHEVDSYIKVYFFRDPNYDAYSFVDGGLVNLGTDPHSYKHSFNNWHYPLSHGYLLLACLTNLFFYLFICSYGVQMNI